MFTGIHNEDMMGEAIIRKKLEDAYRHAERMRRDMAARLEEVAESRDYWDAEASRLLVQIERYRSEIKSR